MPLLCPAGTFGEVTALSISTCSGSCAPGFYCPAGSTSATQEICPLGSYCPEGTPGPNTFRCPLGTYNDAVGLTSIEECPVCEASPGFVCAVGSSSTPSEDVIPCPLGHYCTGIGLPLPCPSGTYGDEEGLDSPDCSGLCPEGQWCAEGTADPAATPCPGGYYCPRGTTNYTDNTCWEGYECAPGTPLPYLICPQGAYCPPGVASGVPCPGGTFGRSEGLKYANCSGVCPASYFCTPGTILYYDSLCPSGSYCPEGTTSDREFLCPAGNFSAYTGLQRLEDCMCDISLDPECELRGVCAAGYYCPAGSGSAVQNKCPFNHYCPQGASEPLLCEAEGYYCLERAHSPFAYENGARMLILETLPEKARRWQEESPVAAQQYLYMGYTLEEAFMEETYKTTYNGPLYSEITYAPVRGLEEINVNVTTYGFFSATVHICDVNNGTDAPVTLEEIGQISISPATSVNDSYVSSARFGWTIPRDALDGDMVICLRMPRGNLSEALVVSDIFQVTPPYLVPPLRGFMTILLCSLCTLGMLLTAPCFLLFAGRSREYEVRALIKRPAPQLIKLLSRLQRIIEPAQFLALLVWNPSIQRAGGAAEDIAFWWTHLIAVHVLPIMGFLTASIVAGSVLGCALLTGAALRIFRLEQRGAELSCAARFVAFEILFVPIFMTLLAPLDCAYADDDGEYLEYEDQVVMRNFFAADLQCWYNPIHLLLSAGSVVIGGTYYYMSLEYAARDSDADLLHVNTVTRYRVLMALSTSPAASVRERVLRVTLDFLVSVFLHESPRAQKVKEFVQHLGAIAEKEPLAGVALRRLITANAASDLETFGVNKSDLLFALESEPTGRLALCGSPSDMLSTMVAPLGVWDLSETPLEDAVLARIASVVPTMSELHTLRLGETVETSKETFLSVLDALSRSSSIIHFFMRPHSDLNIIQYAKEIGLLLRKRIAAAREDSTQVPLTRFDCGGHLSVHFFVGQDETFHDKSVLAPEERTLILSLGQDLTILKVNISKRMYRAVEDPEGGINALLYETCSSPGLFSHRLQVQLRLTEEHTTHVGLALKRIGPFCTLTSLHLDNNRIAHAGTSEIDVTNFERNPGSVALVEGLLHILQHVQRVSIPQHEAESAVQEEVMRQAARRIGCGIATNPVIQTLNVGFGDLNILQLQREMETIQFVEEASLSDAQACALMPIIASNYKVKKVEIHGLPQGRTLSDHGVAEVLTGLQDCVALRKLNFGDWKSGNHFGELSLVSLKETVILRRLVSLDLRRCNLKPDIVVGLADMLETDPAIALESLKLSMNPIGDAGLDSLAKALTSPGCTLVKLYIDQCAFSKAGFARFCVKGLCVNESLRKLILDGNENVDLDALAEALRDGPLATKLETLALAHCGLIHVGPLWKLVAAPESSVDDPPVLTGLRRLNLSNNPGLVLPTLVLPCLENISLQRCDLNNEDAERICTAVELRGCPRLCGLDLSRNEFTDEVAFRIAKVLEKKAANSTLSAVCLTENAFSEECLDIIRRLCPASVVLDL
ncbi:NACHT, LRR and PYD domains-containing protein 12 [Hondaea fermentalgiana]|uniref:NACHT, LRR and PYD domains-containing protein 12 n=1 Tax=Hondaea fermentalgiana TaxID=2315210 RepID=A0A2R5FYQ3_9STRA|nr:NACHT, LRR and PYD domains-containing protein 12 [Hondaea fermentalgiana]|eukprot:GBG23860.1 NACHT, LRR and PYD domains-containing protein 12 [Hondaea fermentalgiana]